MRTLVLGKALLTLLLHLLLSLSFPNLGDSSIQWHILPHVHNTDPQKHEVAAICTKTEQFLAACTVTDRCHRRPTSCCFFSTGDHLELHLLLQKPAGCADTILWLPLTVVSSRQTREREGRRRPRPQLAAHSPFFSSRDLPFLDSRLLAPFRLYRRHMPCFRW